MLKACIEIISTGETKWVNIPDENLGMVLNDFVGSFRDWECVAITGLKKDGITMFPRNSFEKCDLHDFNYMLLQANDFHYTVENLAVLNLLLEYYNYDCNDVAYAYENGFFKVYTNVVDMGQVALEYLENSEHAWYKSLKDNKLLGYFDFKSYGEEIIEPDGTWLHDKYNKIMVEVFE